MMVWIIGIAGWLVCSVLAYRVIRKDNRESFANFKTIPAWSVMDRWFGLIFSGLFGPVALLSAVIVWAIARRSRGVDAQDTPAKW